LKWVAETDIIRDVMSLLFRGSSDVNHHRSYF
jgi:hypothetical protein